MYAKILPASYETSYQFSRLMFEDHVYAGLSDELHDVYFAHRLLSDIEAGDILVIAVYSRTDNKLCGFCYGSFNDGDFVGHTMFKRKVDAVKAALLCEEELVKYSWEHNIDFKAIVGYPPEFLRVAVRMNKRFGCTDLGIAENVCFYKNGKKVPCRHFRKEIK